MTTDVSGTFDVGRALALQTDGKILLAGPVGAPGTYDMGLARYTPDGDLDPTFGAGGLVVTAVGPGDDWATSLALQPDGKILAAGAMWNGTDWDWAIVRYDPDGSLDGSFGAGGILVADLQGTDDWTSAVAVQPNGKIVVVGHSNNVDADFAVARYNADGSPDGTFNPAGSFGDLPNVPGAVFVRIGGVTT